MVLAPKFFGYVHKPSSVLNLFFIITVLRLFPLPQSFEDDGVCMLEYATMIMSWYKERE